YNNPNDVDNDLVVSANDVLTIINFINAHGSTPIEQVRGASGATQFLDVVADNYIEPDDVIAVINYINSRPAATNLSSMAEGEGGAGGAVDPAAVDACLMAGTLDLGVAAKRKK